MSTIRIGMLGIGTVAKGTYQALEMNRKKIADTTGLDMEIVKILNRDPSRDRGIDIPKEVYTTDVNEIIQSDDIDMVVELIGGIEPATSYMAEAIKNGKSVITANKAAIAANGKMLAELAQEHHVLLRFEAAVAGGIPILTSITTALLSNEFGEVQGILNGTTNYILTKMAENGESYADALKAAQELGFAEADPTADVEGIDAANKLSILISLIFGVGVSPDELPVEGITGIASEDIAFAKDNGYRIKLLASARKEGDQIYAGVAPVLVNENHPIASVNNEYNAVFLNGNAVEDLMFYGKGAGALPTGSAVAGDIIGVARKMEKDSAYDIVPQLRYDADLTFAGEGTNQYYVRMFAPNEMGVFGRIATIFGNHSISVESVLQKPYEADAECVPVIFTFEEMERSEVDAAIQEILEDGCARSVESVLKVIN